MQYDFFDKIDLLEYCKRDDLNLIAITLYCQFDLSTVCPTILEYSLAHIFITIILTDYWYY